MARILVVDDEIGIRELLSEILYDEGHTVELAENAAQARAARLRRRPDLVLLDIWMPDGDGVGLLREWASQGLLDMPVVMMSGHATVDTAIEATRIGAIDFLEKPITLQKLLKTVATGLAYPVVPASVVPALMPALMPAVMSVMQSAERGTPAAGHPHQALRGGGAVVGGSNASGHHGNWLGNIDLNQPLRQARDDFERLYLEHHLERENHSMTRIAERTGLERTHLYRKLKQLGIDTVRKK